MHFDYQGKRLVNANERREWLVYEAVVNKRMRKKSAVGEQKGSAWAK